MEVSGSHNTAALTLTFSMVLDSPGPDPRVLPKNEDAGMILVSLSTSEGDSMIGAGEIPHRSHWSRPPGEGAVVQVESNLRVVVVS